MIIHVQNYDFLWLWLDVKSMLDSHDGIYDWYSYVDYRLERHGTWL